MKASDTIFALSSGAGRAALAVIRVSGPGTAALLQRIAGSLPRPREFTLRSLQDGDEVLDRAIIAWLPGPNSFTGEDCAELHIHGSPAVSAAVMVALGRQPGVRPADAGEFTRRAFLNGKMDLVEVEGLADLLEARTAVQRRQAMRQMSGTASTVFDGWRQQLLLVRADIEAVVDFADEPGVAEEAAPGIDALIGALLVEIRNSVEGAAAAEIIRDGVRVVLAGHPNTGKSSLLNALARREAAIVSDIPGTTRDAIEVSLDVQGIPVILMDTAGLRSRGADVVEDEGIRRSRSHIAGADVVIWVWSADVGGSETPDSGLQPDIVLENKADLQSGLPRNESSSRVSTRTGDGLPRLLERLAGMLKERVGQTESSLIVTARQRKAAEVSIWHLENALAVEAGQLELKAEHIRLASEEIGRITGRVDVEEWLGAIFSRFCIGK